MVALSSNHVLSAGSRGLLAAGCVVAVALAGCGGGGGKAPSDPEQVAAVVRTFTRALADGDGAKACAQLTPGARRTFVAYVTRRAGGAGVAPGTCGDAVGLVRVAVPQAVLAAIRDARVQNVTVSGAAATARVADGTAFAPQRVALTRQGDQWRITAVPTLIGG